jgi:hypothetical protein
MPTTRLSTRLPPGHRAPDDHLRSRSCVALGIAVPVVAGVLCACGGDMTPPPPPVPVPVEDVRDHLPGLVGSSGGGRVLVE